MNPDAAYVELAEAKRAVRASRRAFRRSAEGGIAAKLQAVVNEYLRMRRDGVSREDGVKGIEAELRDCGLFRPTKFPPACETCEDTGYIERTCWDRHRCQRETCVTYPERQHSYVEPCHCPKGDRFRPRQRSAEDAMVAVSKTAKKKTGWRQVGS